MCNKNHIYFAIATMIVGFIACPAPSLAQPGQSGRIVVQKTRKANSAAVMNAIHGHGASVRSQISQLDVFVLDVPQAAMNGITRALTNTGLFTFAEVDETAKASAVPNDPSFTYQWHLGAINAIAAWDMTTGSTSVPIAVIDSGVDKTHPDLASRIVPGWSFVLGSSDTSDLLGHGTATAGTLGAATNNGAGVAGVTWNNPIMPLGVLSSSGYASYSDIANAITYAADHGVRVMNISITGSASSSLLQSAVDYAWNKGAVIFAAAGNSASSLPGYPAACDKVVAVSSTDPGDTLSSFSNFGSWIDVAAPGSNIYTTTNGGGYGGWNGTSFSSPIAAGTAALALSLNPGLSAQGLVSLIENNADDIGAPGFDTSFGYGRVNAYRTALAALTSVSTDTTAPTVQIASPSSGATVTGNVQISGTDSDNTGVARVELWVDGQLDSNCSSLTFACAWNSSAVADGAHALTVKAYDSAGNMGSAATTVTVKNTVVADNQAPSVQIAKPLNGSTVSGVVGVTVNASDNVRVTQVSIYLDGVQKATLSSAPYTYNWNTKKSSSGAHTVSAKAWDAAGNFSSASATVNVK